MRPSTSRPSGPLARSRRPWRTAGIGAAVAACVLAVCGFNAAPGASAGAGPASSPYTITVAQTSGLTDGTTVPVEVTSSDPADDPVGYVDVELCRPGPTYSTYHAVRVFGRCGYSPGSSADTSPSGSATQDFPGEPSGARSFPDDFVAGVGAASYEGHSLNCDSRDPCDLVVSVFNSQAQYDNDTTAEAVKAFKLTFQPFGRIDGCTGTATDALETVSSDRLVDAYTDWSKQACTGKDGPSGTEAPTENTFLAEGGAFGAVDSFSHGNADLAYAAGGYDLPGFSEAVGRPYVAVPIALNAVVVAASGGQLVDGYTPKGSPTVTASAPFSHLEITAGQAASIFGGGSLSSAETAAVDAENPEFKGDDPLVPYLAPGGSTFVYPQAEAGVDSTTDFASTYFTDLAKSEWNSGPNAASGKPKNVQRGIFSSFALPGGSEPAFTSLGLYSARTDLEKAALPYKGIGPLPLWVLSDRATATEVGFTISSLDSGKSKSYVLPTKATMDAAVSDMTTEPDGTLLPDPAKAASAKTPAYPLTFVEYALAPTEPLVDASCQARTGSQQILVKWLKFLTGTGQDGLAPGLVPLTPTLRAQAAAAIAKVGTAAQTGACAPKKPTTTVPTVPTPLGATAPATSPGVTTPVTDPAATTPANQSPPTTGTPTTSKATTPSTVPTVATGKHRLAAVQIPKLPGPRSTDWKVPSIALAVLALLAGAMALRTSGRSPAPLLRTVAGRLRRRKGPS